MSLTLRPRPWKWLGMLLGCLAFCGVAVLMLRDGRLAGCEQPPSDGIAGATRRPAAAQRWDSAGALSQP